MKLALLTAFCLMSTTLAFTQVKEAKIAYHKTQQTAAAIDLPYPRNVVESAIDKYLANKGAKGSESKGFKAFKNVRLEDSVNNDLYFKVEKKSQNESTVYLLV